MNLFSWILFKRWHKKAARKVKCRMLGVPESSSSECMLFKDYVKDYYKMWQCDFSTVRGFKKTKLYKSLYDEYLKYVRQWRKLNV